MKKIKIISIVYSRYDLVEIQREAFLRLWGIEILIAGTGQYGPVDIELTCKNNRRRAYLNLAEQVDQLVKMFPDEDILIIEGDMWPIVEFDISQWAGKIVMRFYSGPYMSILYRPAGMNHRLPNFEKSFNPKYFENNVPEDCCDIKLGFVYKHGCIRSELGWDGHAEIIGGIFHHYNNGDTHRLINGGPKLENKKVKKCIFACKSCGHRCIWYTDKCESDALNCPAFRKGMKLINEFKGKKQDVSKRKSCKIKEVT